MYAVIGLFDEEFEGAVRRVWQGLEGLGLSDYASQVTGRDVHLTLASFETEEIGEVADAIEDFLSGYTALELHFNHISTFLGSSMVTVNPVRTPELLDFHCGLHQLLAAQLSPESLYNPQHWIPHVTLANRILPEKLSDVYTYCLGHFGKSCAQMASFKVIAIDGKGQVSTVFSYFQR